MKSFLQILFCFWIGLVMMSCSCEPDAPRTNVGGPIEDVASDFAAEGTDTPSQLEAPVTETPDSSNEVTEAEEELPERQIIKRVSKPKPRIWWTVDSQAWSATSEVSLEFDANQLARESDLQCLIDKRVQTQCETSLSGTLPDGQYTFEVRAGQVSIERNISIDTSGPVISLDSEQFFDSPKVKLGFQVEDFGAGLEELQCTWQSRLVECAKSQFEVDDLAMGQYTFAITATDRLGNTAVAKSTVTVQWESNEVELVEKPNSITNATSATFLIAVTDESQYWSCEIDSSSHSCDGPIVRDFLVDGTHSFRILDSRYSGARAVIFVYQWTVDTVPPDVPTILESPSTRTNAKRLLIKTALQDKDDKVYCRVNDSSWEQCSSDFVVPAEEEGAYVAGIRLKDSAGNLSAVRTVEFELDRSPPSTRVLKEIEYEQLDSTISFEFECDDARCDFECNLDERGYRSCASPYVVTSVSAGEHTLSIRAIDDLGNVEQSAQSLTWKRNLWLDFWLLDEEACGLRTADLLECSSAEGYKRGAIDPVLVNSPNEPGKLQLFTNQQCVAQGCQDVRLSNGAKGQFSRQVFSGVNGTRCGIENSIAACTLDDRNFRFSVPKKAIEVYANKYFACALDEKLELYCTGKLWPTVDDQSDMVRVDVQDCEDCTQANWVALFEAPVAQVSIGLDHLCWIDEELSLYCAGRQYWGQVPVGDIDLNDLDCGANSLCYGEYKDAESGWESVFAGPQYACGVRSGQLICWGRNDRGQLGTGQVTSRERCTDKYCGTAPTKIDGREGWRSVKGNLLSTCAHHQDSSLHCWNGSGTNLFGDSRLGSPIPKEVFPSD